MGGGGVKYCIGGGRKLELIGYSDNDMAGDKVDRKSTNGMMYFLSNGAVSWQSTKQNVVALSLCEAEYIAASMRATQGVYLSRLMEEMLGKESDIPLLYIDNKADISLIKNPVLHDQSKYIKIKFYYIRECSQHGLIKVDFIQTEEQLRWHPHQAVVMSEVPRAPFKDWCSNNKVITTGVCLGGHYSLNTCGRVI
jgi:hypothetical protein